MKKKLISILQYSHMIFEFLSLLSRKNKHGSLTLQVKLILSQHLMDKMKQCSYSI